MTIIDRNTKVELTGRGILTLRPNDHVATGGEGSVYRVADTVIKLYTDENKMRKEGVADKILLLAPLQSERIIAPEGLAIINGKPRGFYMRVCDGDPLSLFFTNDFRRQKKITEKDTSILVDRMREVTAFSHSHRAIMGDPNEMNWFALAKGKGGPDPRIIDVDSWAIGKFPIRAVMPSVRDWHSVGFTELSDWFSWGVVTFQIYTGIHPYKGTLHGYAMGNMTERMKANASVFQKGVSLNKAVRDFSVIPARLLEWYRAVFQQGERTIPPSPFDVGGTIPQASIIKHVVTSGGTGLLVFEKIFGEVNNPAIKIFPCGIVMLQSGKLIRLADKRSIGTAKGSECEIVKTEGGWLKTEGMEKSLSYSYIHENSFKEENLSFSLFGHRVFRADNRLFLVTDDGITELSLTLFGKPFLSSGKTWNVMTKATVWFDGVGVQDAMGAMYAVLPFGDSACAHVRIRELDGLRVVNGKAGNRFVSLIAVDKNGVYHKLEISLDAEYRNISIWKGITDSPEQNLAILPKGVCATIITDGTLDVFVSSSGAHKKISDAFVTTDMALASVGDTVMYLHNGDVWSLKMK